MPIFHLAMIFLHSGIQSEEGAIMFELRQLEHFLAVVECGTVSKAGERLNITQPALSRSLQNLEYELKTPLFSRSKNKVTLTKTGEFAAQYARKILSQADEMVEQVRLFHKCDTKIIISSCAPLRTFVLPERPRKGNLRGCGLRDPCRG